MFWNAERLNIFHLFVVINLFSQLYFLVARFGPMNTKSISSVLTHLTAKTFADIGVLDFLHNDSVAFFKNQSPFTTVKALIDVGFGLSSVASDWIFGACLVYNLVALAVDQSGS